MGDKFFRVFGKLRLQIDTAFVEKSQENSKVYWTLNRCICTDAPSFGRASSSESIPRYGRRLAAEGVPQLGEVELSIFHYTSCQVLSPKN
jgi:hypothetical protein